MSTFQHLRKSLISAKEIDANTLQVIYDNAWLRIWIPKKYNGSGTSLTKGIQLLQELAEVDGSLGWTVTLCSGANYFARNILPEKARELFVNPRICLGGSGMIGGTAEKQDNGYLINGEWTYATGAPHLTHFTLNAQIYENGELQFDKSGNPRFLSFFLGADQVEIIDSWNTMGLVATASHDFKVNDQFVANENSFAYDHFYGNDILDKIPFQVFADLTLIVNYLGIAKHFAEAGLELKDLNLLIELRDFIADQTNKILLFASEVEAQLEHRGQLDDALIDQIHMTGEKIIAELIKRINHTYPLLGIKAAQINEEINQVYRDFFTATQHKNFRKS